MARATVKQMKARIEEVMARHAPGAKLEEDPPEFLAKYVWQAVAPPGRYWHDSDGHHMVLLACDRADLVDQVDVLDFRIRMGTYRPDAETWAADNGDEPQPEDPA